MALGNDGTTSLPAGPEVWGPRETWGPREFTPFRLSMHEHRDGGARAWVERCLISYYFLKHNNTPATMYEIREWTEALTPSDVMDAVATAATVGLP